MNKINEFDVKTIQKKNKNYQNTTKLFEIEVNYSNGAEVIEKLLNWQKSSLKLFEIQRN